MVDVTHSTSSFTKGSDDATSSCACYLSGIDNVKASQVGYLGGLDSAKTSQVCYLSGKSDIIDSINAYTVGCIRFSTDAYLAGNILYRTSTSALVMGAQEEVSSRVYAYCSGLERSFVHAYILGVYMPSVDYIWLKTSDLSLARKFRVLAQDYDDGTLEKSEDINKTIGGGIDHSVGAVYKTWSPIIRVRHTEIETNFGDMADLETFYSLNNPNGTPSNNITFIDHHNVEYIVHTVGKLTKNAMGCQIDGECAWFLYRLQFIRVQ